MPMPSAGCAADIPSDVCCDSFYLIGERIRTVAFGGVCGCTQASCGDRQFTSYSVEGEPYAILGETLTCTFLSAEITAAQRNGAGNVTPLPVTRLTYRLELRENGWPLPATAHMSTQTLVQADWRVIHALAAHARSHGEKMWRAVAHAAATTKVDERLFRPSLHPFVMERGVGIGRMTPLANTGPQCGYRMDVTVDTQLL